MKKFLQWLVVSVLLLMVFFVAVLYLGVHFASPSLEEPQPAQWTDADRALQAKIQTLLTSRQPLQQLIYDGTRTKSGYVVKETTNEVVFAETFGDSGTMETTISRDRIVRIETLPSAVAEVTLRDVYFFREFPAKHFYKAAPFTIITDESFFFVEDIVKQQQELYGQIRGLFGPLVKSSGEEKDIQILIFSVAAEYQAYAEEVESWLENSFGFYIPKKNRLAVLHQSGAQWVADGQKQLDAIEVKMRADLRSDQARSRFHFWKQGEENRLLSQAGEVTREALRHEGSHQLFYSLGILNVRQRGRAWLIEGLATVCETRQIGVLNPSRIDELKQAAQAGTLVPLQQLMKRPRLENSLAYAEAWSITFLLMQPEYRPGFFAYLDWLRANPGSSDGQPLEQLCRFLPVTPDELVQRWQKNITELVGR